MTIEISDFQYFERILEEMNRRLDERFDSQEKAVQAALQASRESTAAALASAEKAVEKAEASQQRVNVTQNEFRGTLKDQAADLMPRSETEILVKDLRDQIDGVKGVQSKMIGALLFVSVAVPMAIKLYFG